MQFLLLFFLFEFALSSPPTKREWTYKSDKYTLELLSKAQNSTFSDAFHFVMQTLEDNEHILTADFSYMSKIGNNHTSMHFQFSLDHVAEFTSTTPKQVYNDTSKIISLWPRASQPRMWSPWFFTSQEINGVRLYQWETFDGVIALRVRVAEEAVVTPTFAWDPNFVKFDIDIKNYPYMNDTDTRLGIYARIFSQTKAKVRSPNDHKFMFNDDPGLPSGLISWVPTIEINNKSSVPITALSFETLASNFHTYFTILTSPTTLHPTFLSWDPLLGLYYTSSPPSPDFCMGDLCGSGAYGVVGAIVGVAVIGGIAALLLIKRHRRKRRVGYTAVN